MRASRSAMSEVRGRNEVLDRHDKQGRTGMTESFDAVGIALGDGGERRIGLNAVRGIDKGAVNLARQCSLGKTGTNAGGNFRDRDRAVKFALAAVGKGNEYRHDLTPQWRPIRKAA